MTFEEYGALEWREAARGQEHAGKDWIDWKKQKKKDMGRRGSLQTSKGVKQFFFFGYTARPSNRHSSLREGSLDMVWVYETSMAGQ